MPYTLIEAAKDAANDGKVIKAQVIMHFARNSDILRALPIETIEGNAVHYTQEESVGDAGFRSVGEGYEESNAVINPANEPLMIVGGDVKVDRFITDTMGQAHRARQEDAKLKAIAHKFTKTFIKGDNTTTTKEFDGLQKRLTGTRLLANGSSSGGDPLSLLQLDTAIGLTDNPTHLYMPKRVLHRLTQARNFLGSNFSIEKDEFGRQLAVYGDLPILIADRNDDVYSVLGFNEANPGGGSNVGTSIYVLSLTPTTLTGIQRRPIEVRDLGESHTVPELITRIDWYASFVMYQKRAATRLWGITDAAVTA